MKRTLVQVSAIALCWGVATLDILKPGYMQFHDPIPWQAIDRLTGDWGTCPEVSNAIAVPGIPGLTKFFSFPTSLNHWKTRLGDPVCHSEVEDVQTYVWALAQPLQGRIANQENLFIRITFDATGKATSYEFLRSAGSSNTPRDREPEPGPSVPTLGEATTQI